MNTSATSLRRAQRHLEVFEEWQVNHNAAMQCYDFEDWMAEGVRVYGFLEEANTRVRTLIYRGVAGPAPDKEIAESVRALFLGWLHQAESGLPTLDQHTEKFGDLVGADAFRETVDRARKLVDNWPPFVRSEVLAGQHWEVTPDEEPELRAVLTAQRGEPGTLKRDPRPMPRGDAALIR